MKARPPIISVLLGILTLFGILHAAVAAPMKVGGYLLNSETVLSPSVPRFSAPLNLASSTRLVVQVAPQYAVDFGIIPAADLKKWRSGQLARFLVRISGATDTRYVTLKAGSYYVVARNLGANLTENGLSVKVRRFTGIANDNGRLREFVGVQKSSLSVAPSGWDGFYFQVPLSGKVWFDGTFSRGVDRKVEWRILTQAEYQKLISGQSYEVLLSGTNPKALGFHFMAKPARYYFILFNRGAAFSSYTAVREVYQ